MPAIKVLGPGCSSCARTARLISKLAAELGVEVEVEKEADLAAIMAYGVLATPGVVIGERLVHTGGVPSAAQVRTWLAEL